MTSLGQLWQSTLQASPAEAAVVVSITATLLLLWYTLTRCALGLAPSTVCMATAAPPEQWRQHCSTAMPK